MSNKTATFQHAVLLTVLASAASSKGLGNGLDLANAMTTVLIENEAVTLSLHLFSALSTQFVNTFELRGQLELQLKEAQSFNQEFGWCLAMDAGQGVAGSGADAGEAAAATTAT